jgi:hypothetical protein
VLCAEKMRQKPEEVGGRQVTGRLFIVGIVEKDGASDGYLCLNISGQETASLGAFIERLPRARSSAEFRAMPWFRRHQAAGR